MTGIGLRRPMRVDAGINYDNEADSALLRICTGKKVAFKREFAPGVSCDEDDDNRLMGVGLASVSHDAWNIEAVILHYRAQRKLSDSDAMLLRYLSGGLRAALAVQGVLG